MKKSRLKGQSLGHKKVDGEELKVRKRRHLRKVISTEVAAAVDSEETQSDEDVLRPASDSDVNKEGKIKKRRQKQVARTRPATKKVKTDKEKVSLVEVKTKSSKEPVVAGSPTIEELDQQVYELLARPFISEAVHEEEIGEDQEGQKAEEEVVVMDEKDDEEEEEEGEGDVGPSTSERHYRRRSLFSPKRLSVPSSRIVRSCMKYALEQEVKELKLENDYTFEISTQMKADVEMVMEENQTLENENKELKTGLEEEKDKVQMLEAKVKELQTSLEREKERQSRKNDELVASYSKYHELLRKKNGVGYCPW
ncbi:hypothetical protein Dimus_022575 [Dionaea muscipula]